MRIVAEFFLPLRSLSEVAEPVKTRLPQICLIKALEVPHPTIQYSFPEVLAEITHPPLKPLTAIVRQPIETQYIITRSNIVPNMVLSAALQLHYETTNLWTEFAKTGIHFQKEITENNNFQKWAIWTTRSFRSCWNQFNAYYVLKKN